MNKRVRKLWQLIAKTNCVSFGSAVTWKQYARYDSHCSRASVIPLDEVLSVYRSDALRDNASVKLYSALRFGTDSCSEN